MPELSHSPFPAKRTKNKTWPKSLEAQEHLPEPRGSKGKLLRNSKGRQGNSAGRGAQEEGAKARAMLDSGFGTRGGAGNREQGRGKLRKKSRKRFSRAA